MKKTVAGRKQKRLKTEPITEPFLVDDTPKEWGKPRERFSKLPALLREFAESHASLREATVLFFQDAPPEAIPQFEPVNQKISQQGGWSQKTREECLWQASFNLYYIYRKKGEEAIFEDLADWWKNAKPFFSAQWWVKDLLEEWRQQGKEGKRKIEQLDKRKPGEWESPQEKAKREQRNLALVRKIDKLLKEKQAQALALLQKESQQAWDRFCCWRQQTDQQRQQGTPLSPSREKTGDRLFDKADQVGKRLTALKVNPDKRVKYREVLREVTANQQKLGCTDNLDFEGIRRIYEQAKAHSSRH